MGGEDDYHASEVSTRVLVVESHRLVRQGIRSELSGHEGFVVTEASSGLEAIAAASEQKPDVVVLDFELPDRPAPEICAAILDGIPPLRSSSSPNTMTRLPSAPHSMPAPAPISSVMRTISISLVRSSGRLQGRA